jgi:hypothetical protein
LAVICHPEPVGAGGSVGACSGGGGFDGGTAVAVADGTAAAVGSASDETIGIGGFGTSPVGATATGGVDSHPGSAAIVRTNETASFFG